VVDLSELDDGSDIRADDLGVWVNKGVKSSFYNVEFKDDMVKSVKVLDYEPSTKQSSVYRLKRTHWVHSEDKQASCRLFELEGMYMLSY